MHRMWFERLRIVMENWGFDGVHELFNTEVLDEEDSVVFDLTFFFGTAHQLRSC